MSELSLFYEMSILLVMAATLAFIFRIIKQPIILAYIVTGVIISGLMFTTHESKQVLETLSKFGITLLLFLLGLELKFSELRSVGRVALITGLGQIFFTVIIGLIITTLLGFGLIEAFIISLALTFSSTIIIVKLLSDKKEINSLHGKIAIGFLLVQDFCAIIALILLTSIGLNVSTINIWEIFFILAKAFAVFAIVVFLSQSIFPKIVRFLSRNHELLFITSIAWAFGFASISSLPVFGFTIEIGGFLAGLALANSIESTQIISRVKALRDFFIMIFFVTLGASLSFDSISQVLLPALILSLFVLIGNPIIVILILRQMGYKVRTGFMAGLAVAQISEFSLILAVVGLQNNLVSADSIAILTIVASITFTLSTYMIMHSEKLFQFLYPLLKIFDNEFSNFDFHIPQNLQNHIVLIGAHRMGQAMIKFLPKEKTVIVDFDPDRVEDLSNQGYKVVFGDISDPEVMDKTNIEKAQMVISTVPRFEENLILLSNISKINKNRPKTYVIAHSEEDREDLLNNGADEIIMPYIFTGEKFAIMIKKSIAL
jgi:Kef-type K+ transport system membrane component KefB